MSARRSSCTAGSAIALIVVVSIAAFGLALQSSTHLNHDVAWVIYSARRMIEGAVFGRDVIAANPPFAWFISMPPILVSRWFDWPIDAVFRGFVALLAGLVLAYCYWMMRVEHRVMRLSTIGTLAFVLFVSSGRDFGQREHFSVILVLPYLVTAARRMEGQRPAPLVALLTGMAAALGLVFKPYFLAVSILVELVLVRAARSSRVLVRPETIAMAVAGLLCVLVVVVVTPDYLTTTVPLVSKVYWGFDGSPLDLFVSAMPALTVLGAWILIRSVRKRAMTNVFIAAACGYAFAYAVQLKGYTYHALPMNALAVTAGVYQIFDFVASGPSRLRIDPAFRKAAVGLVVLALVQMSAKTAVWYWDVSPYGQTGREIRDVIKLVNTYARHDSFFALSTHPFPGFPTALYVDSEWAGRTNSQIALPAVIKLHERGDEADVARLQETEELARQMFLTDLSEAKPALLLVDVHQIRHAIGEDPFDLLEFYRGDPAIDAILSTYQEVPGTIGFRVFTRSNP